MLLINYMVAAPFANFGGMTTQMEEAFNYCLESLESLFDSSGLLENVPRSGVTAHTVYAMITIFAFCGDFAIAGFDLRIILGFFV